MPRKQTRRSISVSRETYERARAFAEANHMSLSGLVEVVLARTLEPQGASAEDRNEKERA